MNGYKERLKRAYSQYISSAKSRNTCQLTFMECLVLFLHYFLICWLFLFCLTLNVRIIERSKSYRMKINAHYYHRLHFETLVDSFDRDFGRRQFDTWNFSCTIHFFKGFLFFRIRFL